jgi:hypothetical protein
MTKDERRAIKAHPNMRFLRLTDRNGRFAESIAMTADKSYVVFPFDDGVGGRWALYERPKGGDQAVKILHPNFVTLTAAKAIAMREGHPPNSLSGFKAYRAAYEAIAEPGSDGLAAYLKLLDEAIAEIREGKS